MSVDRRNFLIGGISSSTLALLPRFSMAQSLRTPLPIPPIIDASSRAELKAAAGSSTFFGRRPTPTIGFNQGFLGPTLRFKRGNRSTVVVSNQLMEPITCHWHGLHVPGSLDGGPQLKIDPGKTWSPELAVDQPAATLWYHSHVHGRTAQQVYQGLAGMIIIDEPDGPATSLPSDYGKDDIPLIIQDRAFGDDGSLYYVNRGPAIMMGFRGDTILVNGAVRPEANPPAGLVRLRLLNGSNARIYHFRFSDNREIFQIGTDGGLLPAPIARTALTLSPAERAEILVDFSDGRPVTLLSGSDNNSPMGGMMGRMMGRMFGDLLPGEPPQSPLGRDGEFEIMSFAPDRKARASIRSVPTMLPATADPNLGDVVQTRRLTLDMHAGGMGPMGGLGVNGRPFDMSRVDLRLRKGEVEIWEIHAQAMAHPFHVHGTSFRVLSRNGKEVPYETEGMKDVTLVDGVTRILIRFDHPASEATPYMYHCHILEHEDAGMMGQLTVS